MKSNRIYALLILWGFLITGCNPTVATTQAPATKGPAPTVKPEVWRLPIAAVTVDNAAQLERLGVLVGHTDTVNQVAFSGDGRYLVSVDALYSAKVWSLSTGTVIYTVGGKADTRLAFFNADDRVLITIGTDSAVRAYISDSGSTISSTPGNADNLTVAEISADRRILATGGVRGDILLWDTTSVARQRTLDGGQGTIRALAFSLDGTLLAAIIHQPADLGGNIVRVWRVATGDLLTTVNDLDKEQIDPFLLTFSPDGKLLAISSSTQIRMIDTKAFERRLLIFQNDLLADTRVMFSPDSTFFASLSRNDYVYIWNLADARTPIQLPRHNSAASWLAFSPNGQLFLTTSAQAKAGAFVWQTRSFKQGALEFPRGVLAADVNGLVRGYWSPDGRWIVLAEASGSLLVYGVPKGS